MSRNSSFPPRYHPFRNTPSLVLQQKHTAGAFSFLHPTHAVFYHRDLPEIEKSPAVNDAESRGVSESDTIPARGQLASNVHFAWTSRNKRKGRHLLRFEALADPTSTSPLYVVPKKTTSVRATLKG